MSKETRTIRPYVGLDSLESVLKQTLLYFGTESCDADGSLYVVGLAPREFLLRPVTLAWASDEAAFEAFRAQVARGADDAAIPLDALSLGAVARTPFLQQASVLFEIPATAIHEPGRLVDLSNPERPAAFSAPFSGFVVDLYLYLNRDINAEPLRPHLKGTWLSRSRFKVETSLGPAILPPTPLTEEVRRTLDLPAKTIRYIHFGDHALLEPFGDSEQPIYYVDDQLLAQLNARGSSAASKSIQMQLALDFVAAVARRGPALSEELRSRSFDDISTSLMGSVVRLAAGPGASDSEKDKLVSSVTQNPEYVIARAEHFIDIGDGFTRTLKDDEG